MNPTELLERTRRLRQVEVSTDKDAICDFYWQLDDWLELGIWPFHQSLSAHAEAAALRGETAIPSSIVTLEELDMRMRRNMKDESWDGIRPLHNRL